MFLLIAVLTVALLFGVCLWLYSLTRRKAERLAKVEVQAEAERRAEAERQAEVERQA
jgi:Flp pilus assembly protein TadB